MLEQLTVLVLSSSLIFTVGGPAKDPASARESAGAAMNGARRAIEKAVKDGAGSKTGAKKQKEKVVSSKRNTAVRPRGLCKRCLPWTAVPLKKLLSHASDLRGRKLHAQAARILWLRLSKAWNSRLAIAYSRALLGAERWSDALAMFLLVFKLERGPVLRAEALFGVARAYAGRGDRSLAVSYYKRILSSYPKTNSAGVSLYSLGLEEERQNHTDKAIALLKKSAEKYPRSGVGHKALLKLGELYQEKREHFAAIRTYQKLVKTHKLFGAEGLHRAAAIYRELGQPAEEKKLLSRLVKDYPYSSRVADAKQRLKKLGR